jgi:BlaI family penicillinase repressor
MPLDGALCPCYFLSIMLKKPTGARLMKSAGGLSRRERQIMDTLYQRGKSSVSEIRDALPNAPGYSAVRAMLRILEEKGHVRHQAEGLKYAYLPTVSRNRAKLSAVKHLMDTFFKDAPEEIVTALLDVSSASLTSAELERIAEMIERARLGFAGNDARPHEQK